METVTPAVLRRSPDDGSATFAPYGTHVPSLDTYDYVEEEWIATGEEDGHSYATTVLVRRPRDRARFSGTVIAEPLHVHGIAPIWIYSGPYILRSGHAWVEITAQKTTLDLHVKASNAQRYESLHIEGPDSADFDMNANLGDREASRVFFSELRRRNRATSTILAQVGAALRSPEGPFAGAEPAQVVLAGHSQTGWVTTAFTGDAHDVLRLADGSSVYDGFFPSGFPLDAFHDVDVPVVQVMSDGDVSVPSYSFVPGHEGRKYRRDDSDKPGDRFRLYELAGIPHMGTRYAPYNDVSLWKATFPADDVSFGPKMNSLPHFELFNMGLHHLVEWVANGTVPPRADRLEVGPDGYFVLDEHGNTRGGVRSAQLDVPHSTYRPNPTNPDGTPSYLTIGSEEPFDAPKLRELYRDSADYLQRFDHRLDELIGEGWYLAEDAEDLRREAREIEIP
ncbi:alpha/beta hydrolase domain-containing protein [Streptomyces sp. NBC_01485]|uniref:alpha/beta hydrolase domain-containing protein n=1 Tax=Streptomyces sp. NBC_01485 TaxID=2903884 RepID=UPI002E335824|nr:alpha/beta hydrolase domain-containing protein [Streptomyces sp. NBC_01485]